MWLGWMWMFLAHAADGTYYLESAAVAERTAVDTALRTSVERGCPGRVVRKFVVGQGWVYLFRSEPMTDLQRAETCQVATWPQGLRVRLVGSDSASTTTETRSGGTVSVADMLERVAVAHGGPLAEGIASDTRVFRFVRTTPEGTKIEHVYAERGADRYVEITVPGGVGVSSRFGVVGDKAWMDPTPDDVLDVSHVREQVRRFSPERVLGVPLQFTGGVPAGREYDGMRQERPVLLDERPLQRLLFDGDRARKPFEVGVDVGDWTIRQVIVGRGGPATRWSYSGYRETEAGALYPSSVVVERDGALVDRVDVQELDLAPTLPGEWFQVGGP